MATQHHRQHHTPAQQPTRWARWRETLADIALALAIATVAIASALHSLRALTQP